MKSNLMSLVVLATLASCNGGGGSSSKSNTDLSPYSAYLKPKRGIVAKTLTTGTDHSYDFTGDMPLIKIENQKTLTRSTIIKVEGNNVYKYIVKTNLTDFSKETKIEIESEDSDAEKNDSIKKNNGRIVGNRLYLDFSEQDSDFGDEYDVNGMMVQIKSSYSLNMNLNLLNPHCDSIMSIKNTSYLVIDGVIGDQVPTSQTQVSTCEAVASDAQLKALDLSSVNTCDYRGIDEDTHSPECEVKDMRHLTADL